MKIPIQIKALVFLRFIVRYNGKHFDTIEKKFWSYEKALAYKNAVLYVSENLSFLGFHIFKGWVAFYYKYSPRNYLLDRRITFSNNPNIIINKDIICNGWIAEAEE